MDIVPIAVDVFLARHTTPALGELADTDADVRAFVGRYTETYSSDHMFHVISYKQVVYSFASRNFTSTHLSVNE